MYVFIMDPDSLYCKWIFCAIANALCHMFIAATLTVIFMYCLHTKFADYHVMLCSFGYQFFCMEAVLSLNYANGWSTPMRLKHRKLVHILLQICAMICAFAGFVLVLQDYGTPKSAHGIAGTVAAVSSVISLLSGPGGLLGGRYQKIVHMSLGMVTITASATCFCLGLVTDAFSNWSPTAIKYMLMGFVIFYTVFIVVTVFVKCFSKV